MATPHFTPKRDVFNFIESILLDIETYLNFRYISFLSRSYIYSSLNFVKNYFVKKYYNKRERRLKFFFS